MDLARKIEEVAEEKRKIMEWWSGLNDEEKRAEGEWIAMKSLYKEDHGVVLQVKVEELRIVARCEILCTYGEQIENKWSRVHRVP